MAGINYSDKIPNNVNLSEDRTLQRTVLAQIHIVRNLLAVVDARHLDLRFA